ncbi:MAG: efflux RND transporter periplasmic adaptor subunit [Brevundimonas sp.]
MIAIVTTLSACSKPADKTVEPTAQVRTAVVSLQNIDELITAYGRVEFDPSAIQTLTAPFEAQVAQVHVRVGQAVRAGQPVVTLEASSNTRLDLSRLAREAAVTAGEAARLGRLRADGLVSDADVTTATAVAATARQASANLQRLTRGGRMTLVAPVAGVVDALPLSPGTLAPSGTSVASLGSTALMNARLGVEVEDAQRLRTGAVLTLQGLHDEGVSVPARVTSIDRRVDPATRLAAILVAIPRGSPLLPGETLKAKIVANALRDVTTAPRAAILYEGDIPFVFVVRDGKAIRRPVTLGIEQGDTVQIRAGVQAGDRLVIEGGPALSDGIAVHTVQVSAAAHP